MRIEYYRSLTKKIPDSVIIIILMIGFIYWFFPVDWLYRSQHSTQSVTKSRCG